MRGSAVRTTWHHTLNGQDSRAVLECRCSLTIRKRPWQHARPACQRKVGKPHLRDACTTRTQSTVWVYESVRSCRQHLPGLASKSLKLQPKARRANTAPLTQAIIQQAEGHERRQPQQQHQLCAVRGDVVVDSLKLWVACSEARRETVW
jgi:hypothetical protein